MSLVDRLLEELMKDAKARKKFIKFIASEIGLQPEIRLTLAKTVLPEVVTRKDLKEELNALETRLKEYINVKISGVEERLSQRMDGLEKRIDDLYRLVRVTLISLIIALTASILIPLIIKIITKLFGIGV